VTDAVLEIDRVSKRYGAVAAVREVSLTARAGELFGLAGEPGSGRTTIVRIACGVLAPDSGRVRWRSAPIDPATRRRIGYLPEGGGLRPDQSGLDQLVHRAELLGFGDDDARDAALGWLGRLGLPARPGQRLDALAPADRLRIALAATLLADPELLVLDEPFAGLPDGDAELIVELLRERAAAGCPVLLTGSDLELLGRTCHRLGVLREGALIAEGAPADLRAAGPRLLAVDVHSATPDWVATVPGCRLVDVRGTRTLLRLDAGADEQAVLTAAVAAGPVAEFTPVRRTLTELYGPGAPPIDPPEPGPFASVPPEVADLPGNGSTAASTPGPHISGQAR
jgi:ABC-2 type transport system ATP-binding protein